MKKQLFEKPYIYYLIAIFFIYLLANMLISGFYKTIPLIVVYFQTVNWLKLGISLTLTILIGVLVSLNGVLVLIKYKERKKCKGIGTAGIGTAGGLIVGVCPLCVSGILPLIFGLIGISFSFGSLPFQGIEIQALVLLILYVSYVNLDK